MLFTALFSLALVFLCVMLTEVLQTENQDLPDVGTRLEVCLDGMALAQDMASLVAKNTGSAVIIDYGEDFALQDSIRVGPSQPPPKQACI